MQRQWRIAHTCSSLAPWPSQYGRWQVLVASRRLQRRRSSSLLAAKRSVANLSGRLFLPNFGSSGSTRMRSSLGSSPFVDTIQHDMRGFASSWHRGSLGPTTIVPLLYMICILRHCSNDTRGGDRFGVPFSLILKKIKITNVLRP